MKKLLPIFSGIVFLLILLTAVIFSTQQTYAQGAQPVAPAPVQPTGSYWVVDPEVTFIGKNAARSGNMLDWTLQNYQWVCVNKVTDRVCDNSKNPIAQFWLLIVSYIVVPLLFVVILASAMVIIITRGRSLTIMRFLPRFVAIILLIFFSYSIIQFFFQFVDMIQGFFLQSGTKPCPPECISQRDLLYVGWDYTRFIGLRLLGDYNAESAFISLLLTKLTALTYFVMVGILLMRKIILWFFIIVSPIFPILLLYYPTRNTGKIWIGEFFRWLLYAPLFAIFLKGLVFMWRFGIPLVFVPGKGTIGAPTDIIYPTAVNILLGGPRQFVTPTNSVNMTETFALYVVALIMLWIVMLLPWILLQIFLDYAANFSPGDSAVMKTLVNLAQNKKAPIAPVSPGPGSQPGGTGLVLPFAKFSSKMKIPVAPEFKPGGAAKEINVQTTGTTIETSTGTTLNASFAQPAFMPNAQVNAQVLALSQVNLPTMKDIARYDTALRSNDVSKQQEVSSMTSTLERIANPVAVTNTAERDQFVEIREKLGEQAQQGNQLAKSILNAANITNQKASNASTGDIKNVLQQIANPANISNTVNREKMTQLHDMLERESKENNNALASSILSVSERSSASEIEKIRETIAQAQKDNVANSVLSSISSVQKSNTSELKTVLKQIANPASVPNPVDREKLTKLHDQLQKESSHSQLASSILTVSDSTSLKELEKIHDTLMQSQNSSISSAVTSTITNAVQQNQATTKVKSVLQQVANPAVATGVDKEKISKMNTKLSQASREGNELASAVLAVSEKTTSQDIEKLQQKIRDAKEQGNPIATELASMTETKTSLPAMNRVQNVSKEDFQAVKDMWKENYRNMEVPKGMAGTRTDWAKQDMDDIDRIVGLLSSTNEVEVNQGLQEVGNLLPFLLVGGFSQTEIISYLKAKQEAAKEVTTELSKEEEEKVTVSVHKEEAQKTMAAHMEEHASSGESSFGTGEISSQTTTNIVTPQVSNEILAMVELKMPRLREIAQLESKTLAKDSSQIADNQKMQNILKSINNPANIIDSASREKFEKLHEKLIDESQKGNITASVILNAAKSTTTNQAKDVTPLQVKSAITQIAKPENAASEATKKRFTELHERLAKAGQEGHELANSILAVNETTSPEEIQKLGDKLKEEKSKGEPIASEILSSIAEPVIPESNELQNVSEEELEEVRKLWEENYRTLPVPEGFSDTVQGRIDWIKSDMMNTQSILDLLHSTEAEKRNEAMKKVADIMPSLLLGGFSIQEISAYLQAKIDAAKTVVTSLEQEEEKTVEVAAAPHTEEAQKEMAAQQEVQEDKNN